MPDQILTEMEKGDRSSKKARMQDQALPNAEVKLEEEEEEEMSEGGGEGGGAMPDLQLLDLDLDVRMKAALFHCQACLLPLTPPIFKCEASGHVVCYLCRSSHGLVCSRTDTHLDELDAFVGAAMVRCAYKDSGCESHLVYHEAADHQRACRYAPFSCPEPGCAFTGARPSLLDHFAADHSRPATAVRYGRPWNLRLPLSQRWHVLIGEDDRSVFVVSLGELGAATAVSVVCVRADDGAAGPQFWCKLSVELPGDEKDKLVLMTSTVSSSTLSGGAPAPGEGMFLAVPDQFVSVRVFHIQILKL